MRRSLLSLTAVLLAVVAVPPGRGEEKSEKDRTVERLAASARKSVVVITVRGRDGRRDGMGTGFVVGDGLIVTNHHVLGEGRQVNVETADGKKLPVTHVHAFDRQLD